MGLNSFALTDPNDPFIACNYGVVSHPLYHKCEKCPRNEFCEYGVATLALERLEAAKVAGEEGDPFLACPFDTSAPDFVELCKVCPDLKKCSHGRGLVGVSL